VFVIDQRGIFGFGRGDPWTGILNAPGVLCDGEDFKVLALQVVI
jgi:hypothetical protein